MITRVAALGAALGLLTMIQPAGASVIEFWSGQSGADAARFFWYSDQELGPHDPTGHFLQARTGPPADVRLDSPNGWGPLPTCAAALPVFTDEYLTDWTQTFDFSWGSSSLFALPFHVADTTIPSARLYLEYTIDNYLGGEQGGSVYPGIFINGQPISGASHTQDPTAQRFLINQTLTRSDIGPLLLPARLNWIYFNVSDKFPLAGIQVGGRIAIVPEPVSFLTWVLIIVLGALCGGWRLGRSASRRAQPH